MYTVSRGAGRLEFLNPEAFLPEQAGCDSVVAAGRAACRKQDSPDRLAAGDGKDLESPFDEGLAHIVAVSGHDPGFSGKDIIAAPAGNISRIPGGRQPAELFRADRNPDCILKHIETEGVPPGFSVIACTETDQTGADNVERARGILHVQFWKS